MASPVGHAMVGLAAAAVVQHATGVPSSLALWLGAFVASGVPDLDVFLRLIGKSGPSYHRNVSHSLFVSLALWFAAVGAVRAAGIDLAWGILGAWLAALLTHGPLDYLTTGPRQGDAGYGIALWWPLSRRRYYSARPVLAKDRGETTRMWDYAPQAAEEILRIGPLAAGAVIIARLAL